MSGETRQAYVYTYVRAKTWLTRIVDFLFFLRHYVGPFPVSFKMSQLLLTQSKISYYGDKPIFTPSF